MVRRDGRMRRYDKDRCFPYADIKDTFMNWFRFSVNGSAIVTGNAFSASSSEETFQRCAAILNIGI